MKEKYEFPLSTENIRTWTGTTIVAMVKPGTVCFNRQGDVEIAFVIPRDRVGDAFNQLGIALRYPLKMRIEPWKPEHGTVD